MLYDDSEQEEFHHGKLRGFWRRRRILIFVGCFVALNLLSLLLAAIALSKVNKAEGCQHPPDNQPNNTTSRTVTFQLDANLTFTGDGTDLPTEVAVSIQSDGTVRLGGGSTIYQNVVRMKDFIGKSTSIPCLITTTN